MDRLATVVYAAAGHEQSVARLQLQPPELGAVTAVLQVRQNRMDLRLEVASQEARDLVSGGLDRLRDSLQQQGISLDRATISVAPRTEPPAGDQQQSAWAGQQGHGSGSFGPGHGGQQDEPGYPATFVMDTPVAAATAESEAAPVVVSYSAGLNVLA
jgi:flagellar hook-length control protein FliK